MKIQKLFEATTETTPMNEILDSLYQYETTRLLERVIENEPTKVIKVKYTLEIEC